MRRRLLLALVVSAAAVTVPGALGATSASTVALSIVHFVRGCHVWSTSSRTLGPTATLSVKAGTVVRLRVSCPMDFDLSQTAGPRLVLGSTRFQTGTLRAIVFRKAGVYRLVAKNVQTSEEVGLQTLGADNTLRLTVRVR